MSACLKKLKKRAGFTLVEALIVLAILGVLAAVAIPAYSIQLENSRVKVDDNTAATAGSMAVSDYLLNNYTGGVTYEVYTGKVGDNINLKIVPNPVPPNGPAYPLNEHGVVYKIAAPVSTTYKDKHVSIVVTNGTLTTARWVDN